LRKFTLGILDSPKIFEVFEGAVAKILTVKFFSAAFLLKGRADILKLRA